MFSRSEKYIWLVCLYVVFYLSHTNLAVHIFFSISKDWNHNPLCFVLFYFLIFVLYIVCAFHNNYFYHLLRLILFPIVISFCKYINIHIYIDLCKYIYIIDVNVHYLKTYYSNLIYLFWSFVYLYTSHCKKKLALLPRWEMNGFLLCYISLVLKLCYWMSLASELLYPF